MRPETVPLLVVALLLVSAQPGVDTVTAVVDGSQALPDGADAVVVAGGSVTVPADARVTTSVYVIDGSVTIEGTVEGRLVQLAGNVSVGSGGAVTGPYQVLGGDRRVAEGAAVEVEEVAEPVTRDRSPAESAVFLLLQAAGLAVVSFLLGRRAPDLLGTVADAVRHHPVVSGTVGLLASVTLLAVFVFMAFTIILIPVSLLGLAGGLVVYLYAYVALGYLVGRSLPGDRLGERPGVATAAGSILVLVASRLLARIPVIGETIPAVALVVAMGAVVVTYFGLREFEPPQLRPVE